MTNLRTWVYGAATAVACVASLVSTAHARITRIEITSEEPAFGGKSFGPAGAYVKFFGRAYGEVDPNLPQNAIIQDIALAPRNARGRVEYVTDIALLKPADLAKGNGVQIVEVHNRGRKLSLNAFNDKVGGTQEAINNLQEPGDGFLMANGYTLVWFGWQADVAPGDGRLLLDVPIARNPDGTTITGVVRAEMTTAAPTRTLNLSSGWFTTMITKSYPTASTDTATPAADGFKPKLTVRAKEQAPRVEIPNSEWSFGNCADGGAVRVNDTQICYPAQFQPGKLYELTYRAKDPTVIGLGYAAARDVGAFFKARATDDKGRANPAYRSGTKSIILGSSQSGRMIRTMIHLGFNRGEDGTRVYEGAYPHIGGGLMPLNVRFGQPGRAWGDQIDHLYPAYDFPFSYTRQTDPITGRTQGVLDRCRDTDTCPRIFHVATALEVWEGRQSLGLTDPLGKRDVADPANVRTFIMASTQHGPAAYPLPTAPPFGVCQQQGNPNPQRWTMRALLTGLKDWVTADVAPPKSVVPRIADGTLVTPDRVQFPIVPANTYGNVPRPELKNRLIFNPLHVLDYGPRYKPADTSGVITIEPPRVSTASYGTLVPQVDADGNDIGGVRNVHVGAPIGTYTGWNLGRKDRFEDGFCSLSGSFVPFAKTKAERDAVGDPRLSIEERYPTKDAYAAAVKTAADGLVKARLLLPGDAEMLINQAATDGVRMGP
jgi:hypothetical protein